MSETCTRVILMAPFKLPSLSKVDIYLKWGRSDMREGCAVQFCPHLNVALISSERKERDDTDRVEVVCDMAVLYRILLGKGRRGGGVDKAKGGNID